MIALEVMEAHSSQAISRQAIHEAMQIPYTYDCAKIRHFYQIPLWNKGHISQSYLL